MKNNWKNYCLITIFALFLFSCSNAEKESKETQATKIKKPTATKTVAKVKNTNHENHAHDAPLKPIDENSSEPFKLGEHYFLLPQQYDTKNKDKVVVYEFFGYTCPHCYHFEPFMNKWLANKPNYVKLERVPLNFQAGWEVYQKGYLTAELMGIANDTHNKLFDALHKDHKKFKTIEDLAKWYADNGKTDAQAFLSTADSFLLDSKQRKADKQGFMMEITGTPSLVVNGKYKITKKLQNRDDILKVLAFVVEKEAKQMKLIK